MKVFRITFVLSITLIVAGFFIPPIGIDGSVLQGVGFLLMFDTIDKITDVIRIGRSVMVTKGDFTAEVSPVIPTNRH